MMYGFRFDREPDGSWRYVKQVHRDGETRDAPMSVQSAYRFGSYEEARDAGAEWAAAANERAAEHRISRPLAVCNPQYQEVGFDGVSRHLELDPATGGTISVPDTACRLASQVRP